MSENQVTEVDLASLLSMSADDLADIPGFEVPPTGHYNLAVYFEAKEVNKKSCIECNFTVKDVIEILPDATPPLVDTKFSVLCQIGNEFGLGKLKAISKPIMDGLGIGNYGELLGQVGKASSGVLISATVKPRKDKNDPEKIYADVSNVTLAQ